MTQNDKDLLLKDLCSRLPYKVKVQIKELGKIYKICTLEEIDCSDEEMSVAVKHENGELAGYDFDLAKPYLLPMSSMTEEQKDIFGKLWWNTKGVNMAMHAIDYLNKNHFDYRGLIEKGLAIDATGLNIY